MNQLSISGPQVLENDQPIKVTGLRCSNALISDDSAQCLIDNLETFRSYGINTVSVFLMGSCFGDVKGYLPDASLDPVIRDRFEPIIKAADNLGMHVLVGCLY